MNARAAVVACTFCLALGVACASSSTGQASAPSTGASLVPAPEPSPTGTPTSPSGVPPAADTEETAAPAAGACGTERWAVKTGTDAAAVQVDTTHVQDSTVTALGAVPRPTDPTTRVPGVETTVYRIRATLTSYKLESDSDLHLVLSAGAGHTMIGEIPSPHCDAGSAFATPIATARAAFDTHLREEDGFVSDGESVTLTGVGFFDFDHGQRGVAPNAIELHPVLSISFG